MPKVKKQKSVLAVKSKLFKPAKQQQVPKSNPDKPLKTHSKAKAAPQPHSGGWRCTSIIDQQSAEAVAKLLAAAKTRSAGATIKSLTLAPHVVHKKPTFAVTCETLKHLPLLKQLLADVGVLQQHQQLDPSTAYVLTYELLFGQGFRKQGPAEAAVSKCKDAAGWLQQQQDPQQLQHQQVVPHPRTARVNTLKASVPEVLQQLQDLHRQLHSQEPTQQQHRKAKKSKKLAAAAQAQQHPQQQQLQVAIDELLPDVLQFPAGTDLHDHPLVESGVLILQSKASCMPAHALKPQAGWQVLDCCAAPGNKTTHVAALLHEASLKAAAAAAAPAGAAGSSKSSKKRGRSREDEATATAPKVFAFDKDPKRLKRLQANVAKTGAGSIVVAQQADFLLLDLAEAPEYAQVRGVILDPSCSGSGTIISRMDHLLPQAAAAAADGDGDDDDASRRADPAGQPEKQRVEQLAKFQEAAILHALKLPGLQRLVYSTCSIHQRENEDVVAAVLPAAAAAGFHLVDPFPAWHRRGLPVVEGSELLVRTDPYLDGTDGFFVAVFEKKQ